MTHRFFRQVNQRGSVNTAEKIALSIKNPALLGRKLNKYSTRVPGYNYKKNRSVFDRDWDTLVILDACRYDIATQYDWGATDIDVHRSRSTNTKEFYINEVSGRDLRDTVYVTANVWISELADNGYDFNLHRIITSEIDPESVYQKAETAYHDFTNKRIVVHFTQPHFPVIIDGYETVNDEWFCPEKPLNLWGNKLIGYHDTEISREELLDAYKANLEAVRPYVDQIVDNFEGKTVVSADHGQLFGERAGPVPITEWGHPKGACADGILDVPWIVFESSQRREIHAGEEGDIVEERSTDTEERLKQLGYLQ